MSKIPNPGAPQKPEHDHRLDLQQEDHRQEDRQEETRHDVENDPLEASGVDDFLQRLPGSFRWPKPNAEAIAAAVEAVQRMAGNASAQ
ncbi:MAG: hypothetical protein WBV60_12430, partial [Terriglobales bacterium]